MFLSLSPWREDEVALLGVLGSAIGKGKISGGSYLCGRSLTGSAFPSVPAPPHRQELPGGHVSSEHPCLCAGLPA